VYLTKDMEHVNLYGILWSIHLYYIAYVFILKLFPPIFARIMFIICPTSFWLGGGGGGGGGATALYAYGDWQLED
jgi:hypothetical protein